MWVISKYILEPMEIIHGRCGWATKNTFFDDFLNNDFQILRKKFKFLKSFVNKILKFNILGKKANFIPSVWSQQQKITAIIKRRPLYLLTLNRAAI